MSNHGRVYWNEYNTWDAEAAKEYYGAVMGWTFNELPTAGTDKPRPYYVALKDGDAVAGIFTMSSPEFDGIGDHWFTYIAVDDMSAALATSASNGGTVIRDPFEIPGFGKLAIVRDKCGGGLGFLEPVSG